MKIFTNLKTIFLSTFLLFLFTNVSFAQQCKLFENFEVMNKPAAYTGVTVTMTTGDWWLVGFSTMDNNDRRLDTRSFRLRANKNDSIQRPITGENTLGANVAEMLFDKPNGI